jgi:hypothetical protein
MANGITGGLESLLGLNTDAGTAQLQQALAALQAVGVPTAQQLDLPTLQQYVRAGVLTPQQYQAIQANPQAYQQLAQGADQTGTNAQKAALQQLGGIVKAGGSTPINQANLINNINQTNQAMQAARQGIQENAQERGVAGGGQEFLSQLLNEQGNAQNANTGAVNAAANNAQLALQAMTQGGQLGGQLQGQQNQQALAEAQAAQQIAEYNSQLQSAANQYNTQNANAAQEANLANAQNISNQNTGLANYRSQYNAQVPNTIFQENMRKAGGIANAYGNQANLAEKQAENQNQFVGGLLGAGATLGGDYLMGQGIGAAGKAANTAGSQIPGGATNPSVYPGYAENAANNQPMYSHGGEVKVHDPKTGLHASAMPIQMNQGGMCYAQGGEIHDHEICMKFGGKVPGKAQVPGDSTQNDTVPARLSPHEIVLPRTVAQAPNAPQKAAQFVGAIKGQPTMQQGPTKSFADIIKELEANGLELRLGSK